MRPELLRLALTFGLFSTWLVSLGAGMVFGGWIHLALLAALVVFPWPVVIAEHRRDLADPLEQDPDEGPAGGTKDRGQ
jgi:hypothetical protein